LKTKELARSEKKTSAFSFVQNRTGEVRAHPGSMRASIFSVKVVRHSLKISRCGKNEAQSNEAQSNVR
jgi:hypothetical protein